MHNMVAQHLQHSNTGGRGWEGREEAALHMDTEEGTKDTEDTEDTEAQRQWRDNLVAHRAQKHRGKAPGKNMA